MPLVVIQKRKSGKIIQKLFILRAKSQNFLPFQAQESHLIDGYHFKTGYDHLNKFYAF